MNNTHLILTVGTGTAGPHSNLAQGLINSLRMLAPDYFWLLPSGAPDSIAVADMVRENAPDACQFVPWSDTENYATIAHPDSLADSRARTREVIARARACQGGRPGRLLVNPTSGTKQMSAGATIAALDEGVGEIVFTVGDRADGVVMTGTERLESFDAGIFFEERDLALAGEFLHAGAWQSALRLYARHLPAATRMHALAECLKAWCRLDYQKAATCAAKFDQSLATRLRRLAAHVASNTPNVEVLADLLDLSAFALQFADPERSLQISYKAMEYAVRLEIHRVYQLSPPYLAEAILALGISPALAHKFTANATRDGVVRPGLRHLLETLREKQNPFAEAILEERSMDRLMDLRNKATHDIAPPDAKDARAMLEELRHVFSTLALPVSPGRASYLA